MKSPASQPRTSACDRERLRQSLADQLSERDEELLTRHLESCSACQQQLEELAAGREDWSLVSQVLQQESRSGVQPRSAADSDSNAGDDAWPDSPEDFAVDFLEPAESENAIGRLGEIDIQSVIGAGGMGVVLKGHQPELNRPVAVKVLAPLLATSGAARRRFAREAQAAAIIVHPSVMPILTVDSSGRLPYLVMPYVDCESLQQRIDRDGPLEVIDILRIGLQLARGLEAAHAQGLVHRDIKPANILLEHGIDRVLLTDFGLARAADDASLTRTGVIAGTPQFMSPEQARGEAVDARSDLFSLGSVLYTLGTGRPPFRAETSYGILRRITDDEPRPIREINPEIPAWLATLIGRLHRKDVSDRLSSAAELADLIELCLAHLQQPSAVELPVSLREAEADSARERAPSHRRLAFLAAGVVVPVAIAFALSRQGDTGPSQSATQRIGITQSDPGPGNAEAATDKTDKRKPARPADDSHTGWNDGLNDEISELASDTDELQSFIEQPWSSPSAADPESQTNSNPENRKENSP